MLTGATIQPLIPQSSNPTFGSAGLFVDCSINKLSFFSFFQRASEPKTASPTAEHKEDANPKSQVPKDKNTAKSKPKDPGEGSAELPRLPSVPLVAFVDVLKPTTQLRLASSAEVPGCEPEQSVPLAQGELSKESSQTQKNGLPAGESPSQRSSIQTSSLKAGDGSGITAGQDFSKLIHAGGNGRSIRTDETNSDRTVSTKVEERKAKEILQPSGPRVSQNNKPDAHETTIEIRSTPTMFDGVSEQQNDVPASSPTEKPGNNLVQTAGVSPVVRPNSGETRKSNVGSGALRAFVPQGSQLDQAEMQESQEKPVVDAPAERNIRTLSRLSGPTVAARAIDHEPPHDTRATSTPQPIQKDTAVPAKSTRLSSSSLDSSEAVAPRSPVAFHSARLAEQIAGPQLRFVVHSERAGQVQLSTSLHQHEVQMTVNTERPEMAVAMRAELPTLGNHLHEHALRLGEINIVAQERSLASGTGMSGQQDESRQGNLRQALSVRDTETTSTVVMEEATPGLSRGDGRISILA